MSHLGDLSAALADGELSAAARDRALAHLAGCDECRADVDTQRRMRALLANQADAVPGHDFTARLLGLQSQDFGPGTPTAPSLAFAPASTRPRRAARSAARPRPHRPGHRRTLRRIVAGSASAFALTVALAAVGGSGEAGSPAPVSPPVDQFLQTHTVVNGRLPLGDPGAGVVTAVTLTR